jgi:hypothetical protein
MNRKTTVLITLLFAVSTIALAQKNEVNFSIGAITSSDQSSTLSPALGAPCPPFCIQFNSSTSTGVAFEGGYARQVFSFGPASLDLDIPIVGVPSRNFHEGLLGVFLPATKVSSLFFTPSARIKLFHSSPVSPFVSVGGGLAHFGTSSTLGRVTFDRGTNNPALQFGGGVDLKTPLPHLSFRAEVRDFWARGTLTSSSLAQVSPEHQHNIFAGGGIVFQF